MVAPPMLRKFSQEKRVTDRNLSPFLWRVPRLCRQNRHPEPRVQSGRLSPASGMSDRETSHNSSFRSATDATQALVQGIYGLIEHRREQPVGFGFTKTQCQQANAYFHTVACPSTESILHPCRQFYALLLQCQTLVQLPKVC